MSVHHLPPQTPPSSAPSGHLLPAVEEKASATGVLPPSPRSRGEGPGRGMRGNQNLSIRLRHIIQHRPKPALDLEHMHALARRIVLDLIALDLGNAEIIALGMANIEP